MTGSPGSPRRASAATRSVKSGLSIVISASGRAATTSAAVWRMRRNSPGSRGSTSVSPMTDNSSMSNSGLSPAATMSRPPMPENAAGASPASARISPPPSRSPDGSPAMM